MESAGDAPQSNGERAPLNDAEKKIEQERDSLLLARKHLMRQIESSTNERYSESLRRRVAGLDDKLKRLGAGNSGHH